MYLLIVILKILLFCITDIIQAKIGSDLWEIMVNAGKCEYMKPMCLNLSTEFQYWIAQV